MGIIQCFPAVFYHSFVSLWQCFLILQYFSFITALHRALSQVAAVLFSLLTELLDFLPVDINTTLYLDIFEKFPLRRYDKVVGMWNSAVFIYYITAVWGCEPPSDP